MTIIISKRMKKILIIPLLILTFFLCSYIAAYFFIINFCNKFDHNQKFKIGATQITASDISPHFGFWNIGIKINGIKEEAKNFTIIHNNPLMLMVNPYLFNTKIEYKGKADIYSKIDNKKYKLDAESFLFLNFKYSTKIFKLLYKKKLFELINFISAYSINQKHISILDENSLEILKSNNSNAILLTKHDYYNNFQELKNSPPKFYSISADLNIQNTKNIKFPISIGYIWLPNFDISGLTFLELDSRKEKFNIHSPLDNSSIRFTANNLKSSYLDIESVTEGDFETNKLFLETSTKLIFKETFLKEVLAKYLNNQFLYLFNINSGISNFINSLTKRSDYIFSNVPYEIKIKTSSNIADNYINAKIDHLIIKTTENQGIMANGLGKINTNLAQNINYFLDLNLIITNAKKVINFWTKIFSPFLYDKDINGPEIEKYNQDVNFLTAKKISDFPESKSNDLMFRIKIDSSQNHYMISDKQTSNLLEIYYRTRYEELIKNAATKKDPISYINEVAPELSNIANELIKNIPKNIRIKETLWKKLIE